MFPLFSGFVSISLIIISNEGKFKSANGGVDILSIKSTPFFPHLDRNRVGGGD